MKRIDTAKVLCKDMDTATDTDPETILRIQRMEQYFDALCFAVRSHPEALHRDPVLMEMLQELVRYYDGGLWLQDYTLDEKGGLPAGLKRGVLSQDGVFHLLAQINTLTERENAEP